MSSSTLLRRPLPSKSDCKNVKIKYQYLNKKDSSLLKKPTRLPALSLNLLKDGKQKTSFDIHEDGDINLQKPLGPEPFFRRKNSNKHWNLRHQHTLKSRSISDDDWDLPYPPLEEPSFEGTTEKSSKFIFENVHQKALDQRKQDSVHIVDIDHREIPWVNEHKPWRQALLEQEARNESKFDQVTRTNQMEIVYKPAPLLDQQQVQHQQQQIEFIEKLGEKQLRSTFQMLSRKQQQDYIRSMEILDEENELLSTIQMLGRSAATVGDEILPKKTASSSQSLSAAEPNKDNELSAEWIELYEEMREELAESLYNQPSQPSDTSLDVFHWREEYEYDKFSSQDHTKLNLKAHFIDTFPDLPSQVNESLTWINISFNDFTEIPEALLKAKNMVYLNMRNNPLQTICDGISDLKKLKYLNLSFCCLVCVNPRLFEVHDLEVLDLSHNNIRSLDNKCKKLQYLRELSLDGNCLRALPKGLLKLNLSYLQVSSNFLAKIFWKESFPVVIQSLTALCIDVIVNNEILDKKTMRELLPVHIVSEQCDYCNGHMSLGGVSVIKPVAEVFGAKNLPILFQVCSPTCRKQLLAASHLPRFDNSNGGNEDEDE